MMQGGHQEQKGQGIARLSEAPMVPDHEMIRKIGRGSYGEVWLARNIMGTYRAVKVVHRRSFEDDRPFEREYNGIQRFEPVSRSHESQVDILHVGRHEDCFYYVMELADDETTGTEINPENYSPKTLDTVMRRNDRLTSGETVEVAIGLTTALQHLHEKGLVHRDIKPSNIIFVNGLPKLADIGLVSLADSTRSFVGTEGFLPPEGPGTAQADIYSLGKVLYEACTGRDRKDYPELPTTIAELPDREQLLEINAVIAKACREECQERYESAEEMRQDLLLLQGGKSVRRMRTLERRLGLLKRMGAALFGIMIILLTAYFVQRRQTAEAKRLAGENERLARRNAEQLGQVQLANGVRAMNAGDFGSSLLWLAEAIAQTEPGSSEEEMHRFRFGQLWNRSPRLTRLFPHDGKVLMINFSPDGKRLITACEDGTARIWDVDTGEPLTGPMSHEGMVHTAFFSDDGRLALTADIGNRARLWDTRTGLAIGKGLTHDAPVAGAFFSPDSREALTYSFDRTARIWKVEGEEMRHKLEHDSPLQSAAYSTDGRWIATGDVKGIVKVWRADGSLVSMSKHQAPISSLIFHPAGTRLAITTGFRSPLFAEMIPLGIGKLLDPQTGKTLTSIEGHSEGIRAADVSPDGKLLATASQDGTARIWSMFSGKAVTEPLVHDGPLCDVEFSPDGRWLVTGAEDGTAKIWATANGEPVCSLLQHGAWVYQTKFSPDGTMLATGGDGAVSRIWSLLPVGEKAQQLTDIPIKSAVFGEAGAEDLATVLTVDNVMKIWSLSEGRVIKEINVPQETVAASAGKSTVVLLIQTEAGFQLEVRDRESGRTLKPIWPKEIKDLGDISFLPGYVAVVGRKDRLTLDVIDLRSGQFLVEGKVFVAPVTAVGINKSGHSFGVGLDNGDGLLIDLATGEELAQLKHHGPIHAVEFSPTGKWVLTTSQDQTGRIWDSKTGEPRTPPFRHGGRVLGGQWSPDGKMVVTHGLNGNFQGWDSASGSSALPNLPHFGTGVSVSFSPLGEYIATASLDHTSRIWDRKLGFPLTPPLELSRNPARVRFSTNGQTLYARTANAVWRWDLKGLDLPVETRDIRLFAQLATSQSLDGSGNRKLLAANDLSEVYERLKGNYPEQFELSTDQRIEWHKGLLRESLTEINPFAATFHFGRLEGQLTDDRAQILEAEISRIRITDWPPEASQTCLDLSVFYNLPLTNGWLESIGVHGFSNLEAGNLTAAGIDFQIRGIVQLRGSAGDEPAPKFLPLKVGGIPVDRKATALHFIHGLTHTKVPKGWKVGHYVIHYAEGPSVEIPLRNGVELADWIAPPIPPGNKSQAENSIPVGWQGTTGVGDISLPVQLYLTSWENPLPHLVIRSVDFVSSNAAAWPFLAAISVEPN